MKTRRTFTTQQKLSILKQAAEQGVTSTLKKYGVFPSVYYKWKAKFTQMGEQGLNHLHSDASAKPPTLPLCKH